MYSDYLNINKNFQSSINLELDLDNEAKISEYIPTTDICDVIKRYVNVALGKKKEYATTLVGPYGKGKSFILLIICFLLGKKKSSITWIKLVKKIKEVDSELYDLLVEVKEKDITLMPIIINSNYDNVTQSFQLAISDSLNREGIGDILPKSVFDVCLDLIKKWESDSKIRGMISERCSSLKSISFKELKKGLHLCSPESYRQFKSFYDCINIGLEFNPLVSNDIVKTYKDVCDKICERGYKGIFIIFDEFSKFIENTSQNLMHDLKLIQDFAELSARSSDKSQIHLCCVAHKSISLYKPSVKAGITFDSFKTVEGRFTEVRFNRSLEENYQIVSGAINKMSDAEERINAFIESNRAFYDSCSSINYINEATPEKVLFEGCFPLNPFTVYCLIKLSELVAQNERTLFTFISDTDENSLNTFIHSYDSGLFNVDKIYDYFNDILQKEPEQNIRNIWYRCESLLSRCESMMDKRIIKVLAIILMINDTSVLPANEQIISLALFEDEKKVSAAVKKLIDKHYLRRDILNNTISFALNNSKKIDELVDYIAGTKFRSLDIAEVLTSINERKFVLPHKYNEENKITRFFKVMFIGEDNFEKLKSFDILFENNYCDGIIINLITKTMSKADVEKKIEAINDKRVVVCMPSASVPETLFSLATRYACLAELKTQNSFDDVSLSELNLLIDESETDLRAVINELYAENSVLVSLSSEKKKLNLALSCILDEIYTKKVIINNELINKRNVSAQYQKAANRVMDFYLNHVDDFAGHFGKTSPEYSINFAIFGHNDNGIPDVVNGIKEKITSSSGNKILVEDIIDSYLSAPYGIRSGVMPLLLSKAISDLSDNVILRFQTKEIEINASNIQKACFGEKYTISFSKRSTEQHVYLKSILELFNQKETGEFRRDTLLATDCLRQYFTGLPQIIRVCSKKNNFLDLSNEFLEMKEIFLSFNINPYESIFENLLKACNTVEYIDAFKKIREETKGYVDLLASYKEKLLTKIKTIFDIEDKASVRMGIQNWKKVVIPFDKTPILGASEKQFLTNVSELTFDDMAAVDSILKSVIGRHLEDWSGDFSMEFQNKLLEIKNNVETCSYSNEAIKTDYCEYKELSMMGELLKNSLESVMEEYSESVTPGEKLVVLDTLIKTILK